MKKDTFEIVVPVWANCAGWDYFGQRDYSSFSEDSASAFVPLRAVREGDKYPWFAPEVRAINDIGKRVATPS